MLTRALRYFCHVNGASLLYTKAKDKPTMTTLRNVLYHHVFGTSPVKVPQFDHLRAVVVPAAAEAVAVVIAYEKETAAAALAAQEEASAAAAEEAVSVVGPRRV